jgi:hypothetical protein
MPEHYFEIHADQTPPPGEDTTRSESPHGSPTTATRRRGTRKREQRAEGGAPTKAMREQDELAALEAQGFTPDEAARLLRIADPNQAVMRRLDFHRWLVEHGLLDEFSA